MERVACSAVGDVGGCWDAHAGCEVFPALRETGPAAACSQGLVVELTVRGDVYNVDLDTQRETFQRIGDAESIVTNAVWVFIYIVIDNFLYVPSDTLPPHQSLKQSDNFL